MANDLWIPEAEEVLGKDIAIDLESIPTYKHLIKNEGGYDPTCPSDLKIWDRHISNNFERIFDSLLRGDQKASGFDEPILEEALGILGPAPIAAAIYEQLHQKTSMGWHWMDGGIKRRSLRGKPTNIVASFGVTAATGFDVDSELDFVNGDYPGIRIEIVVYRYRRTLPLVRDFPFPQKMSVLPSVLIPFLDEAYYQMVVLNDDTEATWLLLKRGAKTVRR